PFLAQEVIDPALGYDRRHHVVYARIRGHARADATERRPEPWVARGPCALEDPAAEPAAPRPARALQPPPQVPQMVRRLGLPALGLLEAGLGGRQERVDHVADRGLRCLVEAPCDAPPRDPELLPAPRLVGEEHLLREERREDAHALPIERVAEAG